MGGAVRLLRGGRLLSRRATPVLVREWMAHHQGMSLLAITNLLCDNVVQRWFHANPLVQAAELLLHEMPASKARSQGEAERIRCDGECLAVPTGLELHRCARTPGMNPC